MKKYIIVITFFTLIHGVNGQKLEGIATYKTASTMRVQMDSSSMSDTQREEIQKQLSKALQREFTLEFNLYESSYSQVETLGDGPAAQSGGVMIMVAGGSGSIYRNTKEKQVKESVDLFGKPFLIDDEAEALDWEIGNETKQIGKYECRKATYIREVREMVFDSREEENEGQETVREQEVVAWFTMEIPVNHGPDDYWGLPGLILEVNNGNTTMVCTKVILNPEESISIEIPEGGKVVTREEFEKIQTEKMNEMQEQYRGKGREHRIRVGG